METVTRLLVGAYGPGDGAVHLVEHDPAEGVLRAAGPPLPLPAPSYVLLHPALPVVYATGETAPAGSVAALRLDRAAAPVLEVLSSLPIAGAEPCHLALDPGGRFLLSADYGSGSIGVYGLDGTGAITGQVEHVVLAGSGPDPDRQRGPHVHQITFDPGDGAVRAVDLGTDTVHRFALDPASGALRELEPVPQPAGSGPRHLADHPDGHTYVSHELGGTVGLWRGGPPVESTHTPSAVRNLPSEIAVSPDGRFVYAGNRGANTIAVFTVGEGGALSFAGETASGGDWPRHFLAAGPYVYVANQYSGTVTVLGRDAATGALSPLSGSVPVPGASCAALL